MKKFWYRVNTGKWNRKCGYYPYRTEIFDIIDNNIVKIGEVEYSSGSFRGHKNEIFAFLIENGYIDKQTTELVRKNMHTIYYANIWEGDECIYTILDKYELVEL